MLSSIFIKPCAKNLFESYPKNKPKAGPQNTEQIIPIPSGKKSNTEVALEKLADLETIPALAVLNAPLRP